MEKTCDMHIHTNKSDGGLSCVEVLNLAKERNLKKLSITDHNCVEFYFDKNAQNFLNANKFELIVGCEFTCTCNKVPIEILGYGFDLLKIKTYLDNFGMTQDKDDLLWTNNLLNMFAKFGVFLDMEEVKKVPDSFAPRPLDKIFVVISNNKQIVSLLKQENETLANNLSQFLREGLNNPKSKFFIDRSHLYPDYKKIIQTIHEANGLAFLAHPYLYKQNMQTVLECVKEAGIDGIECFHHTCFEGEKLQYLLDFCENNNLLMSGGSDFHYNIENHTKSKLNQLNIPAKYFDTIKSLIDSKK